MCETTTERRVWIVDGLEIKEGVEVLCRYASGHRKVVYDVAGQRWSHADAYETYEQSKRKVMGELKYRVAKWDRAVKVAECDLAEARTGLADMMVRLQELEASRI